MCMVIHSDLLCSACLWVCTVWVKVLVGWRDSCSLSLSLSLSSLLVVHNVLWFCDLELQYWRNWAETTSLISLRSFFTWLIRMIFSHSSQGWSLRGEKSASNPFSHQVLQVEFENYNNYCFLFSLIIALSWLMLCQNFHFKLCFAGGLEFAVKISYMLKLGHDVGTFYSPFGTNFSCYSVDKR